ncbi:putative leader peptide [Streptomyces sp. NPDC059009]
MPDMAPVLVSRRHVDLLRVASMQCRAISRRTPGC